MALGKRIWIVGMLFGVLPVGQSCAQETSLETQRDAGARARFEGRYGDAETHYKAALEEAEKYSSDDLRLATSFSNLV